MYEITWYNGIKDQTTVLCTYTNGDHARRIADLRNANRDRGSSDRYSVRLAK
jgi:hypothetical protein